MLSVLLINLCQGSPIKPATSAHAAKHQEAKEMHFNRTMATKAQILGKVETSVNKTVEKLTEVRGKIIDVKEDMKAKVVDKLAKEVEKWAAVGDKIQDHKAATIRKLTDKVETAHHQRQAPGIKGKSGSTPVVIGHSKVIKTGEATVTTPVTTTAAPVTPSINTPVP